MYYDPTATLTAPERRARAIEQLRKWQHAVGLVGAPMQRAAPSGEITTRLAPPENRVVGEREEWVEGWAQ